MTQQFTTIYEIRSCLKDCHACKRRETLQLGLEPTYGIGPKETKYMVILGPPSLNCHFSGTNCDNLEEKVLTNALRESGLLGKTYITNIVKCHSPSKSKKDINLCSSLYLNKEVEILKPEKIFLCLPKEFTYKDGIICPTLTKATNSRTEYQKLVKVFKDNA